MLVTFGIAVAAVLLVITPAPQDQEQTMFTSEYVNVTAPLQNATVAKQFTVSGEARGNWYFEASFPIKIQDANNNQVGAGIAQAQEEWMTTEFVPFIATVTVENYSGPATLVLLKDNPSGLPEHDDSVTFPVIVQ